MHYKSLRRRIEKKRVENVSDEGITENISVMKEKTDIQVQEAQSPEKDKPKETHTK